MGEAIKLANEYASGDVPIGQEVFEAIGASRKEMIESWRKRRNAILASSLPHHATLSKIPRGIGRAKVRKGTLPSGEVRWLADYFDAGGNRRAKQFDKRKDADAYLVKVRRDLQLGVHVADSTSITIKEASKLWLERCDAEGLERSTRDAYAQHVNIHIVPRIGARKLSQFNTPHVHAFADELAKDRSPAMVKRVVRSLGAIFVEARRRGFGGDQSARTPK
ncbi:hypothetical protein [Mesorhizobium sp. M0674]|uniref:hypothetical protein n=1 Tax=unclassified Mesorhizobium TaxID=325217 RepID=UPI00333C5DE9